MSKRYEDEIRDLLRGMDRFPGEQRRPAPQRRARWWGGFGRLRLPPQWDARRVMGGALLLMLFAWILRWTGSNPFLSMVAGYLSIVSVVLFVVAMVMLIRAGGLGTSYGSPVFGGPRRQYWRGQVIEFRPRHRGPFDGIKRWFRRVMARRQGPSRGTGPQQRDRIQW